MKNATQAEIDKFYADTENIPEIANYRGIGKFKPAWTECKDNNNGLVLTDERGSYLLKISFNWHRPLEFETSLFAKSTIAAGRGLLALQKMIEKYRPRAVNTSVQCSNEKSLKINRKLFGEPWGKEPNVAWNPATSQYEDVYYFRKIYETNNF